MRNCPACLEAVDPGLRACPDCGFRFANPPDQSLASKPEVLNDFTRFLSPNSEEPGVFLDWSEPQEVEQLEIDVDAIEEPFDDVFFIGEPVRRSGHRVRRFRSQRFEARLAHYLKLNEPYRERSVDDFSSPMVFWSAVSLGGIHPPKSPALIRRILRRIRWAIRSVRGSR